MTDPFELTKSLINIPSPTGQEERIGEFLHTYLNDMGFEVERQFVKKNRFNIYATAGNPAIVLTTHIDTVLPYIPYSEDEEYIYGRGACDTKGIISAQIRAAENLLVNGMTDFGLLFVVGEEAGSEGAQAANTLDNACRFIINGEPTENKLAAGHKGVLRFKLETTGIAAHSAYPERGESAISKLIEILHNLDHLPLPKDEKLGNTTLNIGTVSGGILGNVVPDHAEAEIVIRATTAIQTLKDIVRRIVTDKAQIQYLVEFEPIELKTIDGFETTVVAYGTDIPFLTNWGQPLMLGPGSIHVAHSPEERIAKKEIVAAVDLYVRLIKELKSSI